MSSYIIETSHQFDFDRLNNEVGITSQSFGSSISLRRRADMSDYQGINYGSGSLYNYDKKQWNDKESNFTTYNDLTCVGYLREVCMCVEKVMKDEYGLTLGRARFMSLQPKSCLTYHTDPDSTMRFHIPVFTNPGAMFIHVDTLARMPVAGRLYTFDNTVHHTAINASNKIRTHIVFNGYK